MKQNEKKRLRNYFELLAMYTRELQHDSITKEQYIEIVALMSKNTVDMLDIE